MVPGCVSNLYTLDQVKIALDSLAEWSKIDFICGKVVGMSFEDNGQKLVQVEENADNGNVIEKEIAFDVVSVDIGSTTRNYTSIPGANEYSVSTRPISDLVLRIEKEEETLKEKLR
jgi:NADH dehydrogenase FAD-containing subunit